MDFCYGASKALFDINLQVEYHRVTALIGPSGCGKSTLLRCINRMNDRVPSARVTKGEVLVKGKNIHDPGLRGRVQAAGRFVYQKDGWVDNKFRSQFNSLEFPSRN